jgi:mRNA-degrading endonuclease YafQ of YafQ-DinJ toxin-antitoxin module
VKVYYTSNFKKSAKKYRHLQTKIIKRINIFKKDAFSPQLKTHKLTGKLAGYWSFSVDYHTRIMFVFIDEGKVEFVDIGTHNIYK